jgi:hypothetical protein
LAAPYSISERFIFRIGVGTTVNFASNTLLTPVPEPATLASAFAGLGLFGGGFWLRRRKINV